MTLGPQCVTTLCTCSSFIRRAQFSRLCHAQGIGAVIEDYIKPYGYSTVAHFCGHGIGKVCTNCQSLTHLAHISLFSHCVYASVRLHGATRANPLLLALAPVRMQLSVPGEIRLPYLEFAVRWHGSLRLQLV
eukprot:4977504-Pleurochrysis_carterae.AAC.8